MDNIDPAPSSARPRFRNLVLPLLLFIAVGVAVVITSLHATHPPRLDSITPILGEPGGLLTLEGRWFGDSRQGADITVDGVRLNSDVVIEWSDRTVTLRIPENMPSGMLQLTTREGDSGTILFTNRRHIPLAVEGATSGNAPVIESLSLLSAEIGQLLVINGDNFGLNRGAGQVLFQNGIDGEIPGSADQIRAGDYSRFVAIHDRDFNYYSWLDREIQVFIPEGAMNGALFIETPWGVSNAMELDIGRSAGALSIEAPVEYQVTYGVGVSEVAGGSDNFLDLWLPRIPTGINQNRIVVTADPEPVWADVDGLMRFQFRDLKAGRNYALSIRTDLTCHTVRNGITPDAVPVVYDEEGQLFRKYTAPDLMVPSDNDRMQYLADYARDGEANPYRVAKNMYEYLQRRMSWSDTPPITVVEEALPRGSDWFGNDYIFTMAFCALVRARGYESRPFAGVPVRPVLGFLVMDDGSLQSHYWAEVFLGGIGWMPVDISLGDRTEVPGFTMPSNPREFYFGNLDNRHIALYRGYSEIKALSAHSRVQNLENDFAMQTFHEESYNLERYTAQWTMPELSAE